MVEGQLQLSRLGTVWSVVVGLWRVGGLIGGVV